MTVVVTIKDIIGLIMIGICVLIALIYGIVILVAYISEKFTKHNCLHCVRLNMTGVSEAGGFNYYKCSVRDDVDFMLHYSEKQKHCIKCKYFKEEE